MAGKKLQDHRRSGIGSNEARELREQRRNAAKFKINMVTEAGGVLDVHEVRSLLKLPSVAAVHEAVRLRLLLAVEDGDCLFFPNCQFEDERVSPGILAILNVTPRTSGWRVLQYLFGSDAGLAGDRPIDLIRGSVDDIHRAVRFARVLEH